MGFTNYSYYINAYFNPAKYSLSYFGETYKIFFFNNALSMLICLVIFFLVLTIFTNKSNTWLLNYLGFIGSIVIFLYTFGLYYYLFNTDVYSLKLYQFVEQKYLIQNYNLNFVLGVDGISMCFLLLTTFIFPFCFSKSFYVENLKTFNICLFLVELFIIISFIVTDLLLFYIFFESILIPMFILIGGWGSRQRRIKAAYYFFLYTLFGSLFMLFGIVYMYTKCGSTEFYQLYNCTLSSDEQLSLWICFFLPFAIKIPMLPFHIWLPEAHVESPTVGSVLLASLLLKLGGYGFIRFTLPLFPIANIYYGPIIQTLAILSVIYASLSTIRQIDFKRIIAYSSVAHMNLIVLGLFSFNIQGLDGAMYLMVAHGVVSSGLFFCVGFLYERTHTRLIRYYGGIAYSMPLFTIFFFLLTAANMSFPGTSNFIGELLILLGIFHNNSFVLLNASTGIVLAAVYAIWLFNRICFGTAKIKYVGYTFDVSKSEFLILYSLSLGMILLGTSSKFVLQFTQSFF